MTVALTSVKVFPIEPEASFRNTFVHHVEATLTAANTDTSVALATLGAADSTNAVGGLYLAEVLRRAYRWHGYFFKESQRSPNYVVKSYLSAVSAGGAAAEAYVVTGLKSTDTVTAVTPQTAAANAAYIRAYSLLINNGLTVTYNTDPGANGKVQVTVQRAVAVAGDLTGSDHLWDASITAPTFTFAGSTATPVALTFVGIIETQPGYGPVRSTGV